MRKFLFTVSSFSLLVILVFITIEVSLLWIPNIYSYKRQYLEQHLSHIKVLFIGNSYIEEGIRPELVCSNSFNLAISSRDIIFDAEIAKKYFSRMDSLKFVIIPLDYSKFDFGRGKINPKDTRKNISGMAGTSKCMHYKYMHLHNVEWWYASEILNSQLNYMSRYFQSTGESIGCDSLGYIELNLSDRMKGWEYRALPPIIDTSKSLDLDKYNSYFNNFKIISECCYKNNITLLIVNTPKSELYRQETNLEVMGEINLFIQKLQTRFPNVKYEDFTFDASFKPEDFNDACHLSNIGAIKFSKKIRRSLQKLQH